MSVHVELLPVRPGLGRHVRHDSRSLAYALPVLPKTALQSKRWTRRVPVLDQKQLGSCTGNAGTGWVGTDNAARQGLTTIEVASGVVHATAGSLTGAGQLPVDEQLAIGIYSAATYLDTAPGNYKPTDTGSDGLAVAQVLQKLGLAPSYSHAFSVDAVATALQTSPVLWGTPWYNSMFDTDSAGHVHVDLSSGLAGGHEILFDELEVAADGTVTRLWFTNSWGTSWGVQGRGWVTPAEVASLKDGDFIVPVAAPVPSPGPSPTPQPSPSGDSFLEAAGSYPGLLPRLDELGSKHRPAMTGSAYAAWKLAGDLHLRH